jgi:hypothetical protein
MPTRTTSTESANASADVANDNFERAWIAAKELSARFSANSAYYIAGDYVEVELRRDFINKLFVALGWDVHHDLESNPYRQEVKIERSDRRAAGKADYAFSLAPHYTRVRFLLEAKRRHTRGVANERHQRFVVRATAAESGRCVGHHLSTTISSWI